jgi:Co/Zn/Cd efflux system component
MEHEIKQATFKVAQMDCGSEEQLIRMKLADQVAINHLDFDLATRTVVVTHTGDDLTIERAMRDLGLGASVVSVRTLDEMEAPNEDGQQRKLLIAVLVINAAMFLLELGTGFIAQSMGLVADSLDMLADALVYGLSLYAVGKAAVQKKQVAKISGYLQLALAVFGMIEVVRRFLSASEEPSFSLMIIISLIALAGNAASLVILRQTKSQDAHIQASQIFTSNDVLVNVGVIVAGVLVFVTHSKLPDVIVGAVVFYMVGFGAYRILKLSR